MHMRGIDCMSASSKKKLRKEQNVQAMTERQRKEQAEAKKTKIATIAFITVIAVILVAFVATQAVKFWQRNGFTEKNTVAVTVGDHEINAVTMSYYYNNTMNNIGSLVDQYGASASMLAPYYIGLECPSDLSKPLDEMVKDEETGETWADYYVNSVYETIQQNYALYDAAQKAGFKLPDDARASIDAEMAELKDAALQYGFPDTDTFLRALYMNGASAKSYKNFLTVQHTASAYYSHYQESLEYTDEDYRAHDKDIYNEFSSYSYNQYTFSYTQFRGEGTKGEDDKVTYTAEEDEAGREGAKAAAESLLTATSKDEVATLVEAMEKKPSVSNVEKRLYSTIKSSNEEQAKWLADKDRKEGDIALFPVVTTDAEGKEITNSYVVLVFVARDDNLGKLDNVRHILITPDEIDSSLTGEEKTKAQEEAKAAAKKAAEDLLAQWKEGEATEESFIALAKEKSKDTGSAAEGGLIEGIHRDSGLVTNFKNWAIDDSRKVGDTGIVDSDYGYHIMFYVGEDEVNYRDTLIKAELVHEEMERWNEELLAATPIKAGSRKYMNTGVVLLPATEPEATEPATAAPATTAPAATDAPTTSPAATDAPTTSPAA